jgi:hypothetical protein
MFVCFNFAKGFTMRFVAMLLTLVCGSSALAQTAFPVRSVNAGQTVTVPKGSYKMTNSCTIAAGGRLVVQAGTTIAVENCVTPFSNRGTLEILGTQAEPVRIFPVVGKDCGILTCAWTAGQVRPRLTISYLDYTSSIGTTVLLMQATDFAVSNSSFTQGSTSTSTTRTVLGARVGCVGIFSGCYFDARGIGYCLTIGDGANQLDAIDFIDCVLANSSNSIYLRKQFALLNGSIE